MTDYGFTIELDASFDAVVDETKKHLKNEGFGVLTTIDVKEKLKEKLDVDFRKYIILGACNPRLAHEAIEAEENIGLMLPCNVIVQDKGNRTSVAVIRPTVAMGMIDNPRLHRTAEQVEANLKKVIESLQSAQAVS